MITPICILQLYGNQNQSSIKFPKIKQLREKLKGRNHTHLCIQLRQNKPRSILPVWMIWKPRLRGMKPGPKANKINKIFKKSEILEIHERKFWKFDGPSSQTTFPSKIELPHESFWLKFLQVCIFHDRYLLIFLQLKGFIRKKVVNSVGVGGVKTENIIMSIII